MEKLKFKVIEVSYELEIGKENLKKLLKKDMENEDNDKPKLYQILKEVKWVTKVDYDAMFTPYAIFISIENDDDNTIVFRENIIKKIETYLGI